MKNVGFADRFIRTLVGLTLLTFAFLYEGPAANIGWVGIIPLLTAVLGYCPLYTLLGVNTCPMKKG